MKFEGGTYCRDNSASLCHPGLCFFHHCHDFFFCASRAVETSVKKRLVKIGKIGILYPGCFCDPDFRIIFFICYNHYYEYMYAYKHASKELEPRYLLACIWGKARKEVSCFGQYGTVCLEYWYCPGLKTLQQTAGKHL